MAELEERGLLDRTVEDLPDDAALEARAAGGHGLTRSEIGTLLAFAKIALSDDLRGSAVPDDPYLARELFRYFPEQMREALRRRDRERIACAARSSPRSSPTRSSIAAGRRCSSPRATAPAPRSPS